MSKGIIYVMTTVVPGLIKIGKTGSDSFNERMKKLEKNGYSNIAGLKRKFAIEVEDYDEKEKLLHDIFNKSRVENTEFFAADVDLVIQLLSSFDGKQIYPEIESKEEVFDHATKERKLKADWARIPDGTYYLQQNKKGFGKIEATMKVEDGVFIVLKGSICASTNEGWVPESRRSAIIEDNILMKDIECNSPSTAGWVILGASNNGWMVWKDKDGKNIDIYRNNLSDIE